MLKSTASKYCVYAKENTVKMKRTIVNEQMELVKSKARGSVPAPPMWSGSVSGAGTASWTVFVCHHICFCYNKKNNYIFIKCIVSELNISINPKLRVWTGAEY